MPITNRTLEPGTVLIATYKKVLHRCEVVASDAGPRYRLDGVDHKSPSTAASAVVGGNRNGWTFWSVEGSAPEVPLAIAPVAATFRKTPNQKGVADGGTRWTARPARRASSSRPTKRPSPARRATPHARRHQLSGRHEPRNVPRRPSLPRACGLVRVDARGGRRCCSFRARARGSAPPSAGTGAGVRRRPYCTVGTRGRARGRCRRRRGGRVRMGSAPGSGALPRGPGVQVRGCSRTLECLRAAEHAGTRWPSG